MNLGDGLLFELENGKPKLILLSHGAEKNPAKQLSFKPRAANILNSRQPSCVEEAQGGERPARQQLGRRRETKSKAGGAAASFTSNTTTGGRSSTLSSSKTHEYLKGGNVKVVAKVKSDRHKHSTTVGSLRTNGKTAQPQSSGTQAGGKVGLKDSQAGGHAGLKDSVVCLTSEQLQHILHSVHTSNQSQHTPEDPTRQDSKTGSLINGGRGSGEMKEEDRGGGTDNTATSQDKDNRLSGCPFSWLEERQTLSRATNDAKKAQWRRELDEQVALKQQQSSAPGRLQAEDDTESVYSVQSSISHRDQPAAIRSSLRLGEVTPMEEVLCVERREEQRRRWLEELDRQREETSERRRREKLLQSQTEDHELWAAHFDSLQRRPPVQTAAPSAPPATPSRLSEQGEWDPSSSLSLVWEAASSCGAESVVGASIDTTSGYPGRASHLRTMTALLDPTQIEEREKRRLKQLDQQRAIEAQVEERRRQKEQEEARRREEEKEDERRVALEREMLERQYEIDTQREKQKSTNLAEQLEKDDDDKKSQQDMQVPSVNRQSECFEREEVSSSASPYRDTAVQTGPAGSLSPRRSATQRLCRGTGRRAGRGGRLSSSLCRRGPACPGPTPLLLFLLLLSSGSFLSPPTPHKPEPVPPGRWRVFPEDSALLQPSALRVGALPPSPLSDSESRVSRCLLPPPLLLLWSSFLTSALMKSSTWTHWSLLTPPRLKHTQKLLRSQRLLPHIDSSTLNCCATHTHTDSRRSSEAWPSYGRVYYRSRGSWRLI
ncbi:coiled-coil domain-containing protein 66 isoform X6 [Gymnodraco acuticeps]|uniref:Coiled-coil domain-containing protein 66 isoform X6 n=1 Tax=Gymnodraco acuticeps TaxID=8218 RepID=A0A6P8TNG1_GYMAC|nr:coiled-coil domain-containing protein 66 isoform X6 [Gymnodraco acuticeps]